MGLRLKFNLIPIVIFIIGLSVTGYIAYTLLQKSAKEDVLRNAGLMMETATAIRKYTNTQVKPNLEMQLMRVFLPQSVPAYAATETLSSLKDKYPDYSYKEATINPTNPRDKAVDWEADLVQQFRGNPALKEISGERETPSGRSMYLARPLQIKAESCLVCHDTPATAPKAMVALYGETNGFGWKMNDIIGAQIMSVPMSLPIKNAENTFYQFIAWLVGVFLVLLVVLNLTLDLLILKPMAKLARLADRVSQGDFQTPEFQVKGSGAIAMITQSFNRMRRSLEKAMKLIDA